MYSISKMDNEWANQMNEKTSETIYSKVCTFKDGEQMCRLIIGTCSVRHISLILYADVDVCIKHIILSIYRSNEPTHMQR